MNSTAIISAAIGLVLIAVMIFLVARFAPRRTFPGWQFMLVLVLLLAIGIAVALSFGGGGAGNRP